MNYEQMNNNKVYLYGKVLSEPVFSHELFGESFYEMKFQVERLSSQFDVIPITISERILKAEDIKVGSCFGLRGQFRSYNQQTDSKSKLILTVFVREIDNTQNFITANLIELSGYICKEPIYRTTPFKREICDILLAVNRAYNKSDYLPCIAWGRNARFVKGIDIGNKIYLQGRIQSREYQKKLPNGEVELRVAYEISIAKINLEPFETAFEEDSKFVPLQNFK